MTIPSLLLIAVTGLPPLPWQTPTPIESPKGKEQRIPLRVQGSQAAAVKVTPLATTGFSITNIAVDIMSGTTSLAWQPGIAPYQIWQSPTLTGPWSTAVNTTLARSKQVPLGENQFWKLQAQAPSILSLNSNSQPRLTWTAPDTDMADSLTNFLIEYSTNGGSSWAPITAHDTGLAAGTFLTTTRSANDATTPPVRYRMTEVTANGVTVPYNQPSLNNAPVQGTTVWVKRYGGIWNDRISTIITGLDGSIYAVGVFQNTIDFGGGYVFTALGTDMFLIKANPNGSLAWAVQAGKTTGQNTDFITALGVAVDSVGNITVVGGLTGSATFGGSTFSSTNPSSQWAFIAQFGPSGSPNWSTSFGGTQSNAANGVGIDSSDNVYVTGFYGFANPITIAGTSMGTDNRAQTFLAKYSQNGIGQWAVQFFSGTGSPNFGNKVSVNKATGEILVAGQSVSAMSFGTWNYSKIQSPVASFPTGGGFLAGFNSSSDLVRVRQVAYQVIGDGSVFGAIGPLDISSDGSRIAVVGSFAGTTHLDPSVTITSYQSSFNGGDGFVAVYNNDFTFSWYWKLTGGTSQSFPNLANFDSSGNLIVGGYFYTPPGKFMTLGTKTYQTTFSTVGISDGFLVQLTGHGIEGWSQAFGGVGSDSPSAIAIGSGGIYVGGAFEQTASFDGTSLSQNANGHDPNLTVTSAGQSDGFLMKVNP